MFKRLNLLFTLVLLALLFPSRTHAEGKVYSPSEVPNVNVANRYRFVSDPEGYLDSETLKRIDERLWNLRQTTSVEPAVVIVPSTGDLTVEEFTREIFDSWKIGKSDKDNGVLFLLVPEDRRVRIETGYGVEGVLPDIACGKIINRSVAPNMRAGDVAAAVDAATSDISNALLDPQFREELKSGESDNYSGGINALSGDEILQFAWIVAVTVFIFALGLFFYDLFKARRLHNFDKALMWRKQLYTFGWASLFSLGAALPLLLAVFLMYRSSRNKKLVCDTCGAKMNKLSEEEDNELLSPSQDFEEKLKTVDYDVWECPKCGTIERFPFLEKQTEYSECLSCHTVAMHLKQDNILVKPTTSRKGLGEKIYECEFCHHRHKVPYEIAKKESVDPLVAGAVLGSMLGGGRGSGGGGFGGGFGGGSSGGGGASGGW